MSRETSSPFFSRDSLLAEEPKPAIRNFEPILRESPFHDLVIVSGYQGAEYDGLKLNEAEEGEAPQDVRGSSPFNRGYTSDEEDTEVDNLVDGENPFSQQIAESARGVEVDSDEAVFEPERVEPAEEPDLEWEASDRALELSDQETPKTIWRHNTDLDAPYFGGNFDFLYNGGSGEALTTFNTYLSYRTRYSEAEKRAFIDNLRRAVDVWDGAAEVQVRDIHGSFSERIKLRFKLRIVRDSKNAVKKTDIHPNRSRSTWFIGKDREIVMRDLNVFIGSSRNVLVHELGHVWGLLDEYDTRWIEKKFSPGHVGTDSPLIKDKIAIMNEGYVGNTGEFRGRYFTHFGRALLGAFWGLKSYVIPIKHGGKVVARSVQGRIVLLKRDIAGLAPYANDVLPFNPQFTTVQLAKR